jgi:cytochrome bd-type quinol oxidase subunit 2
MQNSLRNVCASDTSAYRLWLILLVLYALIVGAALWAEFPMSMAWARTPERIATIILGLLLLLLAFWYFSISCRAALWMPLMAFLIAVLGLLAAFWNHPRVTQMLLIQETKAASTTIITPPAKK